MSKKINENKKKLVKIARPWKKHEKEKKSCETIFRETFLLGLKNLSIASFLIYRKKVYSTLKAFCKHFTSTEMLLKVGVEKFFTRKY